MHWLFTNSIETNANKVETTAYNELVDEENLITLSFNDLEVNIVNMEQNDAEKLDIRYINIEVLVHMRLQIRRLAMTKRS